jgi:hypothetical protein
MELVGWEWMVDECHIGYGTRTLLMKDLAQAILEQWNPTDE